nr:hypothetical protein [Tanacetum cinerariifolium]
MTVAHGQSLGVLLSLCAVSESGSHVTDAVSGSVYSTTVAVSGAGTPVHTLAHGGSEAHGSLGVLLSLCAVSESGSHVTDAVSGSVYSTTVAVSGAGTPVHTLAHGGSEAHGVLVLYKE